MTRANIYKQMFYRTRLYQSLAYIEYAFRSLLNNGPLCESYRTTSARHTTSRPINYWPNVVVKLINYNRGFQTAAGLYFRYNISLVIGHKFQLRITPEI